MTSFFRQRAVIKSVALNFHQMVTDVVPQVSFIDCKKFITLSRQQGKEIIVVSSGGVAARRRFNVKTDSGNSIAGKTSDGCHWQTQMMANWARFFDFPCAQNLVNSYDFAWPSSLYVNVKNTYANCVANNAYHRGRKWDTVRGRWN